MAAQYRVDFTDGHSQYVFSADSKSMKRKDVRVAYVKARKKGEAKHAKFLRLPKLPKDVRARNVMCVG
jgi:hypothetical protein